APVTPFSRPSTAPADGSSDDDWGWNAAAFVDGDDAPAADPGAGASSPFAALAISEGADPLPRAVDGITGPIDDAWAWLDSSDGLDGSAPVWQLGADGLEAADFPWSLPAAGWDGVSIDQPPDDFREDDWSRLEHTTLPPHGTADGLVAQDALATLTVSDFDTDDDGVAEATERRGDGTNIFA
ncbi:MAG TPA: hypothetical protein VGF45_10175, partial [Polyangia bacterium]